MPRFKILQAEVDGIYVLKFIGEIRLNLCITLEQVIENMLTNPKYKSVVIDLSETEIIDSTTLGLLARIAVAAKQRNGVIPTIISTNPDVTRIVKSMGFDRIFIIVGAPASDIEQLMEIPLLDSTEDEVRQNVIKAHRVLMDLNHRNQEEFRDLVAALENECHQE